MLRAKLPERLYEIKENLTDTGGTFTYQTNLPNTNWNWNNFICKQCHKTCLKPMPTTNELCCEICGALETLDGAYFVDAELHKCGDFKIVKQRRTRRKYSFMLYMEKHRKSSQQTDIHCPLNQSIKPMRYSRELKNICPSESRHRLWLTRS